MKKPGYLSRFILYDFASIITFLIDITIVWLLTQFLHFHYLLSVTIGLTVAVMLNYIIGRKFIFVGTKRKFKQGYVISLIIAFFVFLLILALTYSFVNFLGLNYLAARFIAGIIAGILSYAADSYFTYKMPFLPRLFHIK